MCVCVYTQIYIYIGIYTYTHIYIYAYRSGLHEGWREPPPVAPRDQGLEGRALQLGERLANHGLVLALWWQARGGGR